MSRLLSQAAAEAVRVPCCPEDSFATLKTALPPCRSSLSKACEMCLLCAMQSNADPLHQDRASCREVHPLPLHPHPSPPKCRISCPLVPPPSACALSHRLHGQNNHCSTGLHSETLYLIKAPSQ